MILVMTVIHLESNKKMSISVGSELTRLLVISKTITSKIYLSRKFLYDNIGVTQSNTSLDQTNLNKINNLLKRHRLRIVPKNCYYMHTICRTLFLYISILSSKRINFKNIDVIFVFWIVIRTNILRHHKSVNLQIS